MSGSLCLCVGGAVSACCLSSLCVCEDRCSFWAILYKLFHFDTGNKNTIRD
jgi:hypothetical protein